MPVYARNARRWVLRLATAASILLAGVLVWLFAPKGFRPLNTLELAGLLGLLVLPAMTAWSVAAERRLARRWQPNLTGRP